MLSAKPDTLFKRLALPAQLSSCFKLRRCRGMTGYLERPPLAPDQCRMTVLAAPSPSVSAPDADPRRTESGWSKPVMAGMILLAMTFGWLLVS